jgi:hypothetical protein
MDSFLAASGLLIERLRDQRVTDNSKIRPAPSAGWAVKNALDGAVNVIFFDDIPEEGQSAQTMRGKFQNSQQLWLIIVSSKNVSDAGAAASIDAGIILLRTLVALQGYRLSPGHGELQRKKSPYRAVYENGFAHLPVLFSTQIITTGSAVPW